MPGKKIMLLFLIIVAMLSSCSNVSDSSNEALLEASDIAGYRIATLTYLPAEFKERQSIEVHEKKVGDLPPLVTQIWNSEEPGHFLLLQQDPNLRGLGNSEPIEIRGVPGEKNYREPTGESLPILTLFWREGEMSFTLTGTLSGSLDEETMYKIAESVK